MTIKEEGEEKGTSRLSELVTRYCIEGDRVIGELVGTADWKEEEGKSRNSELETEKINDEEKTVEVAGKNISQDSPV